MDIHASGLVEEADADEIVFIRNSEVYERRWRRVVFNSGHNQTQYQLLVVAGCDKGASVIFVLVRVLELSLEAFSISVVL